MSIPNPIVLLDARAKYVHPAFQMSRASTKTVFDSTGKLVTVPANALGWDHDPATGQARGYLAETQATNLLLHSNDLTQGAWTNDASSVTPGAATGPDGDGMAKLVENSSSSGHQIRQDFTITDGDTIAATVLAKAGERTRLNLIVQATAGTNVNVTADLAGGTITGDDEAGGATLVGSGIQDFGAGLYRVWVAGTLGSGLTSARVRAMILDGNGSSSYQGDGTSGLYLGYCQAEVGSYPTSYIETGAATATRSGDALVLPDLGVLNWGGGEQGTLLLDVTQPKGLTSSNRDMFQFAGGGSSPLYCTINPSGVCFIRLESNIFLFNVANSPADRRCIAAAWDVDTVVGALDGSIAGTSAASVPPSFGALGLGTNVIGALPFGGHIRRAVYYPQRLSNADLQSLTAIQE